VKLSLLRVREYCFNLVYFQKDTQVKLFAEEMQNVFLLRQTRNVFSWSLLNPLKCQPADTILNQKELKLSQRKTLRSSCYFPHRPLLLFPAQHICLTGTVSWDFSSPVFSSKNSPGPISMSKQFRILSKFIAVISIRNWLSGDEYTGESSGIRWVRKFFKHKSRVPEEWK
jgi:hypothetical protein